MLGGWQTEANAASAVTVNLKNFGAIGDNVADDGPALQKALDALASAGGGTLIVPQGRYAIITPVVKDFTGRASSITILGVESLTPVDPTLTGNELSRGLDLVSEFTPRTGSTKTAINIIGLQTLLIKDITFLGTANASTDAKYALLLDRIEDATVRHCEFYGLASLTGAVLMAQQSRLHLEQIKFLGCGGSSGAYLPIVQNIRWKGITLTDVIFIDYGQRELFSKTVNAMPISWVNIGNAEAVTPDSPRREVIIRNAFFDEGSYSGITSLPHLYQPPSAPVDLVYIERVHVNVNNSGGSGSYFDGLRGLLIEKSVYTWSHRASACFETQGVGHAIIDQMQCLEDADLIIARTTTGRLSLVNSVYTLNSLAQVTKIFNTTPENDPVQYIRQRYNVVLGHEPDPASHFYWSDLLLRCGDDSQCAATVRANLDAYLGAAPPSTFNIAGRVADANGLALSGITVTLNGSQALTTLTDAAGRYHFNNLPTSGSYTVNASKPYYTFAPPTRSFNAPTANQTADFVGTAAKFTISGRVLEMINSTPMQGVTITVNGSQSATTTTDSNGNFSFQLPALGNYTLTPSLKHYAFQAPSLSFNNLTADQTASFTGKRNSHTISGVVTMKNGTPMSGVYVILSETVATTDAAGRYSFTGLPAGGNYKLTPSKANYVFEPSSLTFNDLSANQTANFTTTLPTYRIGGNVTAGGLALSGVTITLNGSQSATTTTDANGSYSLAGLTEGNYTVTASKAHYTFDTPTRSFTALSSNQTADFTATINKYTIGGRLLDVATGNAMQGVTVTVSGSQSATTSSDSNGNFSFQLPALGNYTLTPSLKHYSFQPASLTFNSLTANQTASFTGKRNSYTISGVVTEKGGTPMSGVSMSLSGNVVTTDAKGSYSFTGVAAGANYTLTISKAGYIFVPSSLTFNDLAADQTASFVGNSDTPSPILISHEDSTRAVALDSVLRTDEPFNLTYDYPWSSDRRTRILIYATAFDLQPGETAQAVSADVQDASGRIYPLTVEHVSKVLEFPWLTRIVVRLNDDLTDVGDVLLRIKYRGVSSNRVRVGIGHVGGGPPDDPGAVPTPGRP